MDKKKNGFINFICAFIPGAGYMYNGLMKRGLEQISIFMASLILLANLGFESLGLIIAVPLWFYNFFDTFNVRNSIDRGIFIEDKFVIVKNKDLLVDFNNINNKVVGGIFIFLGSALVLRKLTVITFRFQPFFYYLSQFLLPIIFIAIGIMLMVKQKSVKKSDVSVEDVNENRNGDTQVIK